jgi:hypothetical protein
MIFRFSTGLALSWGTIAFVHWFMIRHFHRYGLEATWEFGWNLLLIGFCIFW